MTVNNYCRWYKQAPEMSDSTTANGIEGRTARRGFFRFNDLKIGIRILLVLAMPVIGMLFFGGNAIMTLNAGVSDASHAAEYTQFSRAISGVVHEMQKERGMSAAFIGSKGSSFAGELPAQRRLTDTKHKEFTAAIKTLSSNARKGDMPALIEGATRALQGLAQMRSDVTGLKASVGDMAGYYTGTIAKLLGMVEYMTHATANAEANNALVAYAAFL